MDSQELKIKIESQPLFVQKMIFTMCVILTLLLLLVFFFMPSNYDPGMEDYYANRFFTIIKPQGWRWVVDREGESFIFRKKNHEAVILVDVDTHEINRYCAVNLNPVQLKQKVVKTLTTYGFEAKDVEVSEIKADKHEWVFSCVKFQFKTKRYEGFGKIFHVKDMSCVYLGMWKPELRDDYEYSIRMCAKYIRMREPYDKPLFVRPVVDTSEKVDYLELQHGAQNNIKLATKLWKSDKGSTSNNTKIALKAFQTAFKKLAEADDMAYAIESETMEQYLACKKAREDMIERMVSKIIQQDILQNDMLALQRLKQLISMATLDSEAKIREWAKQQYQKLRPDREESHMQP